MKTAPPNRNLRSAVLLAAGLMACVLLGALAALSWFERRAALDLALSRADLIAMLLEDQATRAVDSSAVAMQALADSLEAGGESSGKHAEDLLSRALLGMPAVRSLAIVDDQGQILASTDAKDQGAQIDLSRLGRWPGQGRSRLQALQQGRHLRDLAGTPGPSPQSFLPLVRQMRARTGGQLLVALVNPDSLANFQQTALADGDQEALLLSYAGELIGATDRISQSVGSALGELPAMQQMLKGREHGSQLGPGAMGPDLVTAWRASRHQPLVVLVEEQQDDALRLWRHALWTWSLIGGLGSLLITLATAAVLRSLRNQALAREQAERAHEQVALREREMSVVLRSVQELIFRAGPGGVLTFVNARWNLVSEPGADRVVGRRLQDLVQASDVAATASLFDAEDRRAVRSAKIALLAANGALRQFEVAVVPLYTGGQLVGFAGSAVDVTERESAQQHLQQQLAITSLLLEVSPQPISLIDMEGRYRTVNKAWEAFMGRTRDEVLGRPAGYFRPAEERDIHELHGIEALEQAGELRYEARLRHRDGSMRDMLVTKVLLRNPDGGLAGVLKTLTDVSEFREAERATREARDAAEEASRSKSEFIANISHELRTPLQSILGYSELGAARGRDQVMLATMFDSIHASGQRMLALVNDLLDVSKIESAVGTMHMERCDLRGQIRSVVREFDPLLQPRQLQLDSRLPEVPLSAKVDPLRFQQVIRNVLANAVKFSPAGGRIALEAGHQDDGQILIAITDRGPGIPPEELESIFDPFVQSSKTKDGSGGTGLGLAICRKLVELHGGTIKAENRDGGGAKFSILLPARSSSGDTQFAASI